MLAAILPILHRHKPGTDWWDFGGGTALSVHLEHRVSYDIDIFIDSSKHLKALTPQFNADIKNLLGNNSFEYPGYYLKLYQEHGEIDFIIGSPQTEPGVVSWEFNNYPIMIETPEEIIMKKIIYRGSKFKNRDVFDLAAVLDSERRQVMVDSLSANTESLPLLLDRIGLLEGTYEQQIQYDVNPLPAGRKWMTLHAIKIATDCLSGILGD